MKYIVWIILNESRLGGKSRKNSTEHVTCYFSIKLQCVFKKKVWRFLNCGHCRLLFFVSGGGGGRFLVETRASHWALLKFILSWERTSKWNGKIHEKSRVDDVIRSNVSLWRAKARIENTLYGRHKLCINISHILAGRRKKN